MEAIITVPQKRNLYTKYNGLTFEVTKVGQNYVALKGLDENYPENTTDFHFSEVLIVGIKKEFETDKTWKNSKNLLSYIQFKKIQF